VGVVSPTLNPKVEDRPLSAVATGYSIYSQLSSILNLRTRLAVVTRNAPNLVLSPRHCKDQVFCVPQYIMREYKGEF